MPIAAGFNPPIQLTSLSSPSSTERTDSPVPYQYVAMAIEALAEHDLDIEQSDRLNLTVQLALEARDLFFVSTVYEPSDDELDQFFQSFIMRSFIADPYQEAV